VNFTREADIKATFAEIMQGQLDPQEMVDKMVSVIGADDGNYRNVWPPTVEDLIKQTQATAWTRPVRQPGLPDATEPTSAPAHARSLTEIGRRVARAGSDRR
jgi:hypothetical protein